MPIDETFSDGDVVRSGELEIQAIATPGHCPDHTALLVNGTDCLTADCLFKGTVGGTMGGGPTGYADQYDSIMNRLMGLPHETRIHPGHTLPSTIGDEWEHNPFIRIWRGEDPEGTEPCSVRGERGDADPLRPRLRRHAQGVGALSGRPRRDRRREPDRASADIRRDSTRSRPSRATLIGVAEHSNPRCDGSRRVGERCRSSTRHRRTAVRAPHAPTPLGSPRPTQSEAGTKWSSGQRYPNPP